MLEAINIQSYPQQQVTKLTAIDRISPNSFSIRLKSSIAWASGKSSPLWTGQFVFFKHLSPKQYRESSVKQQWTESVFSHNAPTYREWVNKERQTDRQMVTETEIDIVTHETIRLTREIFTNILRT